MSCRILILSVCAMWTLSTGCANTPVDDPEVATVTEEVGTPAWSYFVGKTLAYDTCAEFCGIVGKTCVNTCTTSRGYPNWGAEAWFASSNCPTGNGAGQQYCAFAWDDVVGGANRWKCCCQ